MIATPDTISAAFAATPVPSGPISPEAARAIARILWDAAEAELANENNTTQDKEAQR